MNGMQNQQDAGESRARTGLPEPPRHGARQRQSSEVRYPDRDSAIRDHDAERDQAYSWGPTSHSTQPTPLS